MLKKIASFLRICFFLSVIPLSIGLYLIYYYSRDLPDYSKLSIYKPPSVTRIYSGNGKLMEEYGREHRYVVPLSSVPPSLVEAFLAAEDKNFFEHPGIDFGGLLRAAFANIFNLINHRRVEGGSTITQQVVKNFLLTPERTIERKVKEAVLSYMISQTFSKEQILELYLNQIYFGRGAYGIAIAASNFFGKSLDELTLEESALLAAMPKAPSNFNPDKNYAKTKERRDYVLARMYAEGFVSEEAARAAMEKPIKLIKKNEIHTVQADYYSEIVREEVIKAFGEDYFYEGGLTIITNLDPEKQKAAEEALVRGIKEKDRQSSPYGGPLGNIGTGSSGEAIAKFSAELDLKGYGIAVVSDISGEKVSIGSADGASYLDREDSAKTLNKKQNLSSVLKKGDVIVVEKLKSGYGLRQIPKLNGAILVMEPGSGKVLAAQGGYSFKNSKFNRVTQALRQPGSLIKPFVYLAGLENGIEPNRIFQDAPISVEQGAGMPSWRPKNYKGDFLGNITMRTGLEKSRNLITVRIAKEVGLDNVAEIIKRFGINDNPGRFFSMVLGSLETTLLKITAAYASVADSGKKVEPRFIELIKDSSGKVVYARDERFVTKDFEVVDSDLASSVPIFIGEPDAERLTDEADGYILASLLRGVVERGTGRRAYSLGKIIGGKTGTSNDSKDTWFIGFTPRIVVGTYIGYDEPRSLGKTATGSSVAAPIFVYFMEKAYKNYPSLPFVKPDSVILKRIDPKTGDFYDGPGSIEEAFKTKDHKESPTNSEEGKAGKNIYREVY